MPEPYPQLHTLQEENQRLRRAVEELSVLNDLARAIGASLDSKEIMQTIIRRSLRAVNAEQGVITMVEEQAADPMKTLVRAVTDSSQMEQFHLHQALTGWMHLHKKPLIVSSPHSDERFSGVLWDESIHSLVCVPMMVKSELKGVLTVYNKKEGKTFTDDDQRLLAILAAQSAQIVENARLNERDKLFLKMEQEVRLAAKIQSDLLPQTPPSIPGYEIACMNIPAQEVGGDHYDFIPIDDRRLAMCLGDVSGKGLPASLLMSNLQATLRSQAFSDPTPQQCVQRANTLLFQSTSPEKYATLFYCLLDYADHQLTFTNAGHEFPFLVTRNGEVHRLQQGGLPVGMMENFPFEQQCRPVLPGDLLVISSDGIAEAMNASREQFGDDRLGDLIRQIRDGTAGDVLNEIVKAVKAHVGVSPQMDDMTLVVLKRLA
jgi:sigma-B regulation protein RsbU (phosphoserine phosphatase)